MLRQILVLSLICATMLSLSAINTTAQVYYMYPQAPVVDEDTPAIGALFGIGEHDLIRLLGFTRFNMSTKTDLGLELVLDNTSDWRIGLGADVKYGIIPTNNTLPFDLAAQLGFGFETGSDVTNLDIPIAGVISRSLSMDNGRVVTPFGGLFFVIRHYSSDVSGVSYSDTDFDVEVRGGASVQLWDSGDAFLGVHIGDAFLFTIGFNARV